MENIRVKDRHLIKVLIAAAKKAITKKWGREGIPTQDQWTHQVEEIHTVEKIKAPPETVRRETDAMDSKYD